MKILFIVPYPINTTPSQHHRFEQCLDYLKANGAEIVFSPFVCPKFRKILYEKGFYFKKILYVFKGYWQRIRDILRVKHFDIIYLHLEASPFGPPFFEYIFRIAGKPIIYDIDDFIYLPHVSDANRFIQFLKYPRKVPGIMKLSTHIIVTTEYLGQFASRFNKNVTVIPPVINTDKYYIKDGGVDKKPCIGWTGSHSTSKYLLLLETVLREINCKYDVRIKVIGNRRFRIEGLNVETKDWALGTEVEDMQDMDIGLYPLPKDEWIMGKGGGKALQYMGIGIPAVCSKVGAALQFIQDGINGFLADSDKEWVEKISKLIEDPQLRRQMGLAARKTVEERYSVKVNAPKYLNIFYSVCGERK